MTSRAIPCDYLSQDAVIVAEPRSHLTHNTTIARQRRNEAAPDVCDVQSRFKGNRQIEPCYFESLATDINGEVVFGGQLRYVLDKENLRVKGYIDHTISLS